jgi:hypothetical protein
MDISNAIICRIDFGWLEKKDGNFKVNYVAQLHIVLKQMGELRSVSEVYIS